MWGMIIIWKSSKFIGQVFFQNDYTMSVELVFVYSGASWTLANIYAPCTTLYIYIYIILGDGLIGPLPGSDILRFYHILQCLIYFLVQ
jgi:hypothetical protein